VKRFFALAVSILLLAPAHAAQVTNRSLATVNGEPILQSEFEKTYAAMMEEQAQMADKPTPEMKLENKKKLLDNLIDQKLVLQEAKKRKLRVTQRDLESGVIQVKARFLPQAARQQLEALLQKQSQAQSEANPEGPDLAAAWKELEKNNASAIQAAQAEFQKELTKEGLDQKRFEDRIKDQLLANQLTQMEVRSRAKMPSDEDIKALFDKVIAVMQGKAAKDAEVGEDLNDMAKYFAQQTGEKVRARHILVKVPKDAGFKEKSAALKKVQGLKKKIESGEDFGELAEKNSDDTPSAKRGGDLGIVMRGLTVPPFEKALFELPVGKVSDPVETEFGYHLILVEEKKASSKLRLEDVKDDLGEYLFNASGRKSLMAFVQGLRKTATIKVTANLEEIGQ
jgi:parvulin-like peptidyl-prolyl isomerase